MRRFSWKTWVVLLVLVLVGIFVWRHWGPYTIKNAHPLGTNIIAFGDSLTYGTGAPEGENYPAQLSRMIGRPIIDRGVPGDTTASALKRLDRDVLEDNPKVVLLCLGGNDLLHQVKPEKTFGNLNTMITRIQERGALVIVIGLSGMPLYPRYDSRYRSLARRTGCPYVLDILGGIFGDPKLMSDSIHPNARGYAIMARKIEPVLQKYIGS